MEVNDVEPYKIQIIAILEKLKESCDRVISNYDGDCDDDYHWYKYSVEKANYIGRLIEHIVSESEIGTTDCD